MLVAANGIFNNPVESSHTLGPCTARVVTYIAKRAAKNLNSEASQTIVPPATRLGRLVFTDPVAIALIGEIIPEIDRNASFRPWGVALLFGETDHPKAALVLKAGGITG